MMSLKWACSGEPHKGHGVSIDRHRRSASSGVITSERQSYSIVIVGEGDDTTVDTE